MYKFNIDFDSSNQAGTATADNLEISTSFYFEDNGVHLSRLEFGDDVTMTTLLHALNHLQRELDKLWRDQNTVLGA